jgi:hypothetical protein
MKLEGSGLALVDDDALENGVSLTQQTFAAKQ